MLQRIRRIPGNSLTWSLIALACAVTTAVLVATQPETARTKDIVAFTILYLVSLLNAAISVVKLHGERTGQDDSDR